MKKAMVYTLLFSLMVFGCGSDDEAPPPSEFAGNWIISVEWYRNGYQGDGTLFVGTKRNSFGNLPVECSMVVNYIGAYGGITDTYHLYCADADLDDRDKYPSCFGHLCEQGTDCSMGYWGSFDMDWMYEWQCSGCDSGFFTGYLYDDDYTDSWIHMYKNVPW